MSGRGVHFYIAVGALALSHHPARAADDPVRLAPTSQWHLDYADDSCRLARQFGAGDQTSFLLIERYRPGENFRLSVVGKSFGAVRSKGEIVLRFGPAEGSQEVSFMEAETGETPTLIFSESLRIAPPTGQEQEALERLMRSDDAYLFDAAPIGPERESAATFLSVDASGIPEIVFETGSLGEPFAALRKCMDELLTHWGIDVERHKSITRAAVPIESPGNWLRSSDYPRSLLRKGAQGIVHFRLSVDSEGKVSECHIQRSTRPKGFDDAVCGALMRRATFRPALDAEGNPTASYYINTVQFMMP
jgi:TonB family protein